jgi:hypothetical protein
MNLYNPHNIVRGTGPANPPGYLTDWLIEVGGAWNRRSCPRYRGGGPGGY